MVFRKVRRYGVSALHQLSKIIMAMRVSPLSVQKTSQWPLGPGLDGIRKGCPHVGHKENGFVSGISQPQNGQVMDCPIPYADKYHSFQKGHHWRTPINVILNSNKTVLGV